MGAAGVSLKLGSMAGCGATDFPKVSRAAFVRGLTDAWMGALAGGSALGSGRGDKSPRADESARLSAPFATTTYRCGDRVRRTN